MLPFVTSPLFWISISTAKKILEKLKISGIVKIVFSEKPLQIALRPIYEIE